MGPSRIFGRLFLVYAGLCILLALALSIVLSAALRDLVVDQMRERLETAARGMIRAAEHRDAEFTEALAAEVHDYERVGEGSVVLLDAGGHVLAGKADEVQLLDQPEIVAALSGQTGQAERITDRGRVLLVAVPVDHAGRSTGILRLTASLTPIDERIAWQSRLALLLGSLTAAIAMGVTYGVASRIVQPLAQITQGAHSLAAEGSLDLSLLKSHEEFEPLGRALTLVQRQLSSRVDQLRENSERLATVLGSMVEGVVAVQPDETIILANEASRKLLDIAVEDPVGRPLVEVTRSLAVHSAFREALDSPNPVMKEFDVGGGSRRTLALRANRLPGEPSPGVMLVLHDVSELRRLENLRREFVANVSHELKTPLASIKAYAETLKLGALNDPEHSHVFLARIEEQADRLHQLILDLIHLARVESGQEAFHLEDIELGEMVRDCLDQFAEAAAHKQIVLTAEPPGEDIEVWADYEGLRTILTNLIDNAIKYTPRDGRVVVRWQAEGPACTIEVQDSGIGIPEKEQGRIFERFYRVDKARSREVGGTGLGLSIVKHLAQAFGGTVGLESEPQSGSIFRVRLPCSRQPAALRAAEASS
jgi:two-component system phosphate regulon sensor histidine kinase PhoR